MGVDNSRPIEPVWGSPRSVALTAETLQQTLLSFSLRIETFGRYEEAFAKARSALFEAVCKWLHAFFGVASTSKKENTWRRLFVFLFFFLFLLLVVLCRDFVLGFV